MENEKKYNEWYYQSDYDLETAESMLSTGRNVYCIFMCHLSIEKALKGFIVKKTNKFPPRTHNLIYLIDKTGVKVEDKDLEFIYTLNRVSVPTRYPEDLRKLILVYTKERTIEIFNHSKKIQKWIKKL